MRMNRPGDFTRVFRQGKRCGGTGLTLIALPSNVGHPRLGLAIAKKHIKLACQRNRIKRLIRDSFRQHQHQLGSLDIVVLSRADILQRDITQVRTALGRHWMTVKTQWQQS
ncbi:ribonuclease P protein component [Methylophaga frappieri]|jgi:ribonuclease P protein component|nr:ribonuclease P protein component [Methylophaga frappieri]